MKKEAVVKEAREWVGLAWQHQASLKGVACDCVGLIRGVHKELTGEDFESRIDYPATWHLFKIEPRLYNECKKYLKEIPIQEAGEGDLLLFAFRERFPAHHMAILTAQNTLIHSYMDVGKVVETQYNREWKGMLRHVFRFAEVE